jgi:ParB family chromosome partitioning protein
MAERPALTAYNDIFASTAPIENAAEAEKVVQLDVNLIEPHPNNPYNAVDDEEMDEFAALIKEHGVLTPAIVRPLPNGKYQMLAGHKRLHASIRAGLPTIPTIIKDADDDEAAIIMTVTNKQRENALPSERARSYKMHYEALRRKASLPDGKSARDIVAEKMGVSSATLWRYTRLNDLVPNLLALADKNQITLNVGCILADLTPEEQENVFWHADKEKIKLDEKRAARLKAASAAGTLKDMKTLEILRGKRAGNRSPQGARALKLPYRKMREFFRADAPPQEMEDLIFRLLTEHFKEREAADSG